MKTIKLTIILSLITILGYTQKCEHNNIALATKYSGNQAVVYKQYNYIESKNGYYEIYVGDKEKEEPQITINVKYLSTTNYNGETYFYEGLCVLGETMYKCSIETKTKLSDYIKGKVIENTIYFNSKDVIKLYYWDENSIGIDKVSIVFLKD